MLLKGTLLLGLLLQDSLLKSVNYQALL